MNEVCGDNRFEIINAAKEKLLTATNIESDKAEMAVLDRFLFRCWQMGWLEPERTCRYEPTNRCTHACTSCGREVETLHLGYNYCPNCGARVVQS